ncbi:MAG TPA: hypothetical protein IGS53_26305 [Leptolyngbyaceae cyanobacterium M33_DOE_097]|nr:hypothetical protein [Leptolyngbyaceae cyanobacterium M33_DOE_097]
MPEISSEELRNELTALRADVGKITAAQLNQINPRADSEWSAHGNWKSTSASLPGDFEVRSALKLAEGVEVRPELQQLMSDASSTRLQSVAGNLSRIMTGG